MMSVIHYSFLIYSLHNIFVTILVSLQVYHSDVVYICQERNFCVYEGKVVDVVHVTIDMIWLSQWLLSKWHNCMRPPLERFSTPFNASRMYITEIRTEVVANYEETMNSFL